MIKGQKVVCRRGTYIAQLSFQDYLVVVEEHLDLPLQPRQLCSQLSRHLLRQPTGPLNCCHFCFRTSEYLSQKILGIFNSRPEDLTPNIKVEVWRYVLVHWTDEIQMSGAPHRIWKDFDKVFDINWIGRWEGSWELVMISRENVYCSIFKLFTELRNVEIWPIDGAQITLDVRQCAQVQFSAEVLRWGFQSSFRTC